MIEILITKEVETAWGYSNKKHYESLGYIFTKFGDKFVIPVEHLTRGNDTKLLVECDCCKKLYYLIFNKYKQYMEKYGENICYDCRHKHIWQNRKATIEDIRQQFFDRGYELLSNEYENETVKLHYICPKHGERTVTYHDFKTGKGCRLCADEKLRGENNYNWKGGTSSLHEGLRTRIYTWKKYSMKNSNYKCDITNTSGTLNIHHLFQFRDIVNMALNNLGMKAKHIGEYTDNEFSLICLEFDKVHEKYGRPICLREDVHKLFHSIYGKRNNTPEQYYEFKERYLKGEFDVSQ